MNEDIEKNYFYLTDIAAKFQISQSMVRYIVSEYKIPTFGVGRKKVNKKNFELLQNIHALMKLKVSKKGIKRMIENKEI